MLEIAAGAGEHAAHMAGAFPGLTWRPTDPDEAARASIEVWRAQAGLPNLLPPLALDAADPDSWPVANADAVVCINMVHISPWRATQGLMAGAGQHVIAEDDVCLARGHVVVHDLRQNLLVHHAAVRAREIAI